MKSIKACCFFLISLSVLSQNTFAIDQQPVTTSGESVLHLCMPPERNLIHVPQTFSGRAHCKIEDIFIKAYRDSFNALRSNNSAMKLLNAGINGQHHRGQNLLTFSVMNGFRRLSVWGLENGADINRRDLDGQTMLYAAVYHKLPYMLRFSLHRGADINREFYIGDQPVTALRAMIDKNWPLTIVEEVLGQGAATRDERELQLFMRYALAARHPDPEQISPSPLSTTWSGNRASFKRAEASYRVHVNMADTMDRYLRYYMETGYLSQRDMNAFEVHGKRFEHFLAINGFAKSLEYRLHYSLQKKLAENRVYIRDTKGNDVLQAAIQSRSHDTVRTVLKLSSSAVNQQIPNRPDYENKGDRPLDTARRLKAKDLIELLISYNAYPHRH